MFMWGEQRASTRGLEGPYGVKGVGTQILGEVTNGVWFKGLGLRGFGV